MPHLPEADRRWIMDELGQRGVNLLRDCLECGRNDWGTSDEIHVLIAENRSAPGGATLDPTIGRSMFVIDCNNCGYVRHFTLSKIGYGETERSAPLQF